MCIVIPKKIETDKSCFQCCEDPFFGSDSLCNPCNPQVTKPANLSTLRPPFNPSVETLIAGAQAAAAFDIDASGGAQNRHGALMINMGISSWIL